MRRRAFTTAALAVAGLLLLSLLVTWTLRFRIATDIVNRKLADAHVPASYRLTRIGPFRERMENVRIGPADAPDLVARRIDVELGYGWGGPAIGGIRLEGVRVRARLDRSGLSLGAIDRLMPKGRGGQAKLPDLLVSLHDVRVVLATPNGTIEATIEGAGNPQIAFQGRAQVRSPALRLASCDLRGIGANIRIAALNGKPRGNGPLRIAHSVCPATTLGAGSAGMSLSSDELLQTVALRATIEGFGGRAGPTQFAAISGAVAASGRIGDLTASAKLQARSFAVPAIARRVAQSGAAMGGTPIGPTGQRATGALARLLAGSDARADFTANLRDMTVALQVRSLELAAPSGERVRIRERGGISWAADGWRTDGDIATSGGAMPAMAVQVRQAAVGGVLRAIVRLSDYTAGAARLSASPILLGWDGRRVAFDTTVRIDGPLGDGYVRGLTVPVRGTASASGALVVDQGCQPVSFRQLHLASFTFGSARFPLCGRPILMRSAEGVRIEATSGPVRLRGRTSEGAPVLLGAAAVKVTRAGFALTNADAALGPTGRQTHFAMATLDGRFGTGALAGRFEGASGAIANVPLDIADAHGAWAFARGLLHLKGDLRVSDAAAAARFNPLSTDDAMLDLKDGAIRATATLREPATRTAIAKVDIEHDLSSGDGHAFLDVPGITFAPKGLQPERLTPLTLGVIANVAGTISGDGRIDWSAKGVTSTGKFGTERIDLAAAFGPVTGIRGQVHFTDLLGLVSAPDQEATIAEINPGVQVANGVVHYALTGQSRVKIEDATWPFAGGTLRLEPTMLDFGADAERHLTFRIDGLDAAAFVQQLDFPNISATGTFDGVLPMIFSQSGGRIEAGRIVARRGGGTLAYVGQLSNAQLGTMGKLAFDALKAIRYSSLDISLDGRLDGEMVSRVRFTGVREATPEQSLIARLIRNLPFRFNIEIRAPFRGLVGSARAYMDPRLLLTQARPAPPAAKQTAGEPAIQTMESGKMR